jgi:glycosyltransferase involved in cell wall biosynthesis
MWLSYIIPLYNCGKYIAQCLDSILAQGLADDDYEVIVVNDGSTDNGQEIVAEYSRKYQQIHLINQSNAGVGAARNRGMDEAHGDYVYFVDADDWLYEGGMSQLKAQCKGPVMPDVVGFRHHSVDRYYKASSDRMLKSALVVKVYTSQEYVRNQKTFRTCWTALISRTVILKNELRFTAHIVSEDGIFMQRLIHIRDLNILETNLNIYRYRIRLGSALCTVTKEHIKAQIRHRLDVVKMEDELISRSPLSMYPGRLRREASWYILARYLSSSLPYREIKYGLELAGSQKIYPIVSPSTKTEKLMNGLYRHPLWVYLLSKPFHLFYSMHKTYYNFGESRWPTWGDLYALAKKNLTRKGEARLLSK